MAKHTFQIGLLMRQQRMRYSPLSNFRYYI